MSPLSKIRPLLGRTSYFWRTFSNWRSAGRPPRTRADRSSQSGCRCSRHGGRGRRSRTPARGGSPTATGASTSKLSSCGTVGVGPAKTRSKPATDSRRPLLSLATKALSAGRCVPRPSANRVLAPRCGRPAASAVNGRGSRAALGQPDHDPASDRNDTPDGDRRHAPASAPPIDEGDRRDRGQCRHADEEELRCAVGYLPRSREHAQRIGRQRGHGRQPEDQGQRIGPRPPACGDRPATTPSVTRTTVAAARSWSSSGGPPAPVSPAAPPWKGARVVPASLALCDTESRKRPKMEPR